MIFMKLFFILYFCVANSGTTFLKNKALEISSKHKSIEIKKESSLYPSKNTQDENDCKGVLSSMSSTSLMNQRRRTPSFNNLNEEPEVVGRFISEILTHTLKEENIFLLYDRDVMNHYGWTEIVLYMNLKNKPHISIELQEFDIINIDAEIISGFKYTIICLIYNQKILLDLFLNKTMNIKWAPAKLLIVSLDHQTTISELVFDSSIQRSRYIFIAELTVKSKKFVFQTYSILPFQRNKTGFSQWKVFKGIYSLPIMKNEIFTERYKNFGGSLLHLASVCDDPPFLYWVNTGECIGTNIEILHIISKSLNFRFSVQNETEDGFWVGIENNTFKGMYRDIYHNNKDIIVNYVLMEPYEQHYFDSSKPYLYGSVKYLCRIPGPTPVWKKIFMPFSLSMWIFLLITIIVLIPITFFFMKFGFRCETTSRLSTSFLLVIGIMFRQNVNVTNRSIWYLLYLTVWLIGSLVIMSAYSGNLISFMTFPRYQKRIETVKELVNSNKRTGIQYYGAPIKEYLLDSPIEVHRILGKKLDYFPNTDLGMARMMELVKSNHMVYINTYVYLLYVQNFYNISEETYILKEPFSTSYVSFYFKKKSPLTHPISTKLNRLVETGIYSKIYEKHLNRLFFNNRRSFKQNNSRQKLQIAHLQTAFYALFLGYFISMVIFIIEIIINYHKK
ncbi:UNVERIFIED_CONTAM: hypothetical protein RMT77_011692 [Armadillidium vulgare]